MSSSYKEMQKKGKISFRYLDNISISIRYPIIFLPEIKIDVDYEQRRWSGRRGIDRILSISWLLIKIDFTYKK